MPKKTTILIIILIIFTAGLVFIAVKTEQQTPPSVIEEDITEDDLVNIIPTINPQTEVSFSPAIIDTVTNPQGEYSVDVIINTNGQSISGTQLELSYDPSILTGVAIQASENNIFGLNPTILFNSVDPDLGRISLPIAINLDADEVTGVGSVATITFSIIPSQLQSTQVSILPKTTVRSTRSKNSLLSDAQPLNIILSLPSAESLPNEALPQIENQPF